MYIDIYTSRLKIYELVVSGSKVLEIGSGSGVLANLLSIRKKCRVYCVEKQYNLAVISKNKCVEVLNVDIETTELPYEYGFFDYIVLGNVLEHLRDPSGILMKLKKYLRVDGSIIYSVPNIVNWYSRMTILMGTFEYEKSGVFEETHLRFYNLNSAKRLASESGYRIVWLDVTPSVYLFKERLNFLWYGLAVLWKNLFSDEFIIEARRSLS